jgi:hypothetical protein
MEGTRIASQVIQAAFAPFFLKAPHGAFSLSSLARWKRLASFASWRWLLDLNSLAKLGILSYNFLLKSTKNKGRDYSNLEY